MSWEEALKALREGKRVSHEYFTPDEWFEMKDGRIYCEGGYPMDRWFTGDDWQLTGWSII
ncbi:gp15 [Erwinia phage vB_EamM-Y2]|uniref:Gp15 n=1 Tax=Erwinia phage vB_EamM-Y2 TaxID=1051676 RepID=G0YPW4_9CAUD|nr:gp15 [Erwinia phage vB_EamM-Y2]AEJ81391.1 gp15 [Erwinia phage vB_EamM-Y2]